MQTIYILRAHEMCFGSLRGLPARPYPCLLADCQPLLICGVGHLGLRRRIFGFVGATARSASSYWASNRFFPCRNEAQRPLKELPVKRMDVLCCYVVTYNWRPSFCRVRIGGSDADEDVAARRLHHWSVTMAICAGPKAKGIPRFHGSVHRCDDACGHV